MLKGWFFKMKKLMMICLCLLIFVTTVNSSKSEVYYEIYFNDPLIDLKDTVNFVESTYQEITKYTDKDDVGMMVKLHIDAFENNSINKVVFEESCIKVYLCEEEDVMFTYKGNLQDYCNGSIKRKSWFNIWGL